MLQDGAKRSVYHRVWGKLHLPTHVRASPYMVAADGCCRSLPMAVADRPAASGGTSSCGHRRGAPQSYLRTALEAPILLEVFEGVREGSNIDIESTVATNRRSFNFEAGLEGKAPRWHQVDAAALQLEAIQGDALPDVQQLSATKGSNKALAPSPRTILSACQLIRI